MAEPRKRVYESDTLGMPALKMVLVHARNDAQNAGLHKRAAAPYVLSEEEAAARERLVRRLIERLEELD